MSDDLPSLDQLDDQELMDELSRTAVEEANGDTDIPVDDLLVAAYKRIERLRQHRAEAASANIKAAHLQEEFDRLMYDYEALQHQYEYALMEVRHYDKKWMPPPYPGYNRYLALSDFRQQEFGAEHPWEPGGTPGNPKFSNTGTPYRTITKSNMDAYDPKHLFEVPKNRIIQP